jgi:protein-L-isoaspartate(D-aspartate) O-methyltransferase
MTDFASARRNMVDSQIRPNAVTDRRIIAALLEIPREQFVPAGRRALAYIDEDLPISEVRAGGAARYLMEPMAFARLVQLAGIRSDDVVLDIGCAPGYSTAVLAHIADSVVGLESDPELAETAEAALVELGVANAAIVTGPLPDGYASQAPYDVIVLEGAVETIPDALFAQLRDGGRLVAVVQDGPVGKAMLYRSFGGHVSSRMAFNVSVRMLPGFERPPAFAF